MTGKTGSKAESDAARTQAERITVALIPKAAADLQQVHARTGLSKTDIVNRAITLYEFFDGMARAGQEFLLRDKETGETERVHLL
jgi:hypothetical protein